MTEKELEENSATGKYSMQSGSELLKREYLLLESSLALIVNFQLLFLTEEISGKDWYRGKALTLCEEKLWCSNTGYTLLPSSPMSSDDESEIEDEDLKVELQRLREK